MSVPGVNFAMLVFVVGVGLAATSAAFRYFTQYAAASEWRKWLVLAFNWTAIVVGIGSLVTFFFGGVLASRAFD